MNKNEFETFMYIGVDKILVCVFSKLESKILYKKESKFLTFNDFNDDIVENKIFNFLSENIFEVEKQLNQFISDISLIVNCKQFQSIDISIKQYIYGNVKKKNQLDLLKELKNYIFDNYPDYTLVHYLVNHYLFDNKIHKYFEFSKNCNQFAVDTTFILLNKDEVLFYKKIFKKFQISLKKIMSSKYILNFFNSNEFNECEMGRKISSGFNPNEVFLIEKMVEKKGFFERFFNLFS